MGLREHIRLLQRYWWLIALAATLVAAAAAAIIARTPPTYKASTRLMVYQAPATSGVEDYTAILTGERLVRTFKEAILARPFLEAASGELSLPGGAADLAERVEAQVIRDTQVIVLTVEDHDPLRAAATANALARIFVARTRELNAGLYAAPKVDLERQLAGLQADIDALTARLFALSAERTAAARAEQSNLQLQLGQLNSTYTMVFRSLENVRAAEAQTTQLLHVLEPATPPEAAGRRLSLILLAAFVGGGLATAGITLRDYLNPVVRGARQPGRPVLAIVPRLAGRRPARLVLDTRGESAEAEPYALLLARLRGEPTAPPPRTLLVTSSRPGEGKTTTALNLAATMAEAGLRVVLVDAAVRRPTLHTLLGCAGRRGLTTWLCDEQAPLAPLLLPTGHPGLRLLPAGPATANPARLLLAPRMAALPDALAEHADVVIFDGPALLGAAEGPLLARLVKATLLVVRYGTTPEAAVAEALSQLGERAALAWALLNRAPRPRGQGRLCCVPRPADDASALAPAGTVQVHPQ